MDFSPGNYTVNATKNNSPVISRFFLQFLLPVFILIVCQPPMTADVIKLKSGAVVEGTVLKENSSMIIVDLGFDVLRIPRSTILEIKKEKRQKKEEIGEKRQNKRKTKNGALYTEKQMETLSTAENVSTFAPAVVVIRTPVGLGSGFLINRSGYLVTNFHVIKGQKHISITRFEKSGAELKRIIYKKVRFVALDPFHDLAVLQIEESLGQSFQPTVLGTEEEPVLGEKIFVIGNPLGLERTVTEGVISHTGRNLAGKLYLQIDASVNPGNSGGPLFNSRGQVIGVINMGVQSMQGLNFAIPINHVKFILDHIEAYAYNEANPTSGYVYSMPPGNPGKSAAMPETNENKRKGEEKNEKKDEDRK